MTLDFRNCKTVTDCEAVYKKAVSNQERTCVFCGCTDSRACKGGCHWTFKFLAGAGGICSTCSENFNIKPGRK